MAQRRVRLRAAQDGAPAGSPDGSGPGGLELADAFARAREEHGVPPRFPPDVLADAERAAGAPDLPGDDRTDLRFFTVDPPGSRDLDQAMHLERDGAGYRVRYAIADLTAFVAPGGPVDREARRRGQTVYCPDLSVPLHPPVLSQDAASLLPGQVRPAYVWDLRLDAEGEVRSAEVARALVRSVERLDYAGVQAAVDAGTGDERFTLLREVGERRVRLEQDRGGASLPLPEQEVVADGDRYLLRLRPPSPVEDWNAQISLMTGMAAADMMLAADIGILRTMPGPPRETVARFHRQAAALGARWPAEMLYGEFLRSLDRTDPRQLALVHEATVLFRGAGYTAFEGDVPDVVEHAALAAEYAHVTAPLRRLVDRFALVVCASLCRDVEVPAWVREALPTLPGLMTASDRVASAVERACTDVVEAAVLRSRVGEELSAVVVDVSGNGASAGTGAVAPAAAPADRLDGARGVVQLVDLPVLAAVAGPVRLGARIRVRVDGADVSTGSVRLVPLG
jgi:exoribonuclease R